MASYNISISSSKDELPTTKELYINDSLSSAYIEKNEVTQNSNLINSIKSLPSSKEEASKSLIHAFSCLSTGISIYTNSLIPSELLSSSTFSINTKAILSSILTSSRAEFYSKNEELLAGYILAFAVKKDILRTKNAERRMDNAILRTAGKPMLVETLMLFQSVLLNSIDTDMLPKLDISYETHVEGIKSFYPVLSNYLVITSEIATSLIDELRGNLEAKKEKELRDKELAEIAIKNRQEAKLTKNVDTAYEAKRKEASKALKVASIELYYLNYKKLVTVLQAATSKGKAGSLFSEDTKKKIIIRLDEIVAKNQSDNNKDLRINIATIKDFITFTLSSRLVGNNTLILSSIDKTPDQLIQAEGKRLSLKEKLALAKSSKEEDTRLIAEMQSLANTNTNGGN